MNLMLEDFSFIIELVQLVRNLNSKIQGFCSAKNVSLPE
jgi:hypothetical protein